MNASRQPQARPAPLWREPNDAPTFVSGERRLRVLVVEDDPVQALLLTLMLEHLGVTSTLVTNGAQAIEAVKTAAYALVLMDYLMPVTNGIDATRSIRRWEREAGRPPTPIAAVTASVMTNECQRYIDAGMNEVVVKPFSAAALADLLARHGPARAGAHTHSLTTPGATS
ncbi:MAG: response regulator [Cytophagales bacterium]|nr:response regulator [Rhizobacter sp.]